MNPSWGEMREAPREIQYKKKNKNSTYDLETNKYVLNYHQNKRWRCFLRFGCTAGAAAAAGSMSRFMFVPKVEVVSHIILNSNT